VLSKILMRLRGGKISARTGGLTATKVVGDKDDLAQKKKGMIGGKRKRNLSCSKITGIKTRDIETG